MNLLGATCFDNLVATMNWTVLQTMQDLPFTSSLIANMSHKTKWSEMIWDGSSELARKSCREDLKDGGFLPKRKETMEFCWFLDGPRTQHHWLLWAMDEALLVAGNSQGIVDFRLQLLEMPRSGWILEIVKLLRKNMDGSWWFYIICPKMGCYAKK